MSNFFVIAGPSGVGKTTLIRELRRRHPDKVAHPITYTTRQLRPGEVQGRDMTQLSQPNWAARLNGGDWLATTHYDGHYYGTSKEDVVEAMQGGKKAVVAFDIHGVECVKDSGIGAVFIYLVPAKPTLLDEWLLKRYSGNSRNAEYMRRLEKAYSELEDYCTNLKVRGLFDVEVESGFMEDLVEDMELIMGLGEEN